MQLLGEKRPEEFHPLTFKPFMSFMVKPLNSINHHPMMPLTQNSKPKTAVPPVLHGKPFNPINHNPRILNIL